jgi:hypothetical protein
MNPQQKTAGTLNQNTQAAINNLNTIGTPLVGATPNGYSPVPQYYDDVEPSREVSHNRYEIAFKAVEVLIEERVLTLLTVEQFTNAVRLVASRI